MTTATARILAVHAEQGEPIESFLDSRPADLSDLCADLGITLEQALIAQSAIRTPCPRCKGDGATHGGWDANSRPMQRDCAVCYGTGVEGMSMTRLEAIGKSAR